MSMAGQLMMWNIGWNTGVRDGDSFLGLLYSKNKGNLNDARFSLPEFDKAASDLAWERTRAFLRKHLG